MKSRSKKLLERLMEATSKMGGQLDYTATSMSKIVARQQIHTQVSTAIYHILCDDPRNEEADYDYERAAEMIKEIEAESVKQYKDRNGN